MINKLACVMFVFVLAGCSSSTDVATPSKADSTPAPNLSGTWARKGCLKDGKVGPCPLGPQFVDPETLPFTRRALAFIESFDEALNPKYECSPASIPSLFA